MARETSEIVLSMRDLRAVAGDAAASAQEVLESFQRAQPADARPRAAIDVAWALARGGERDRALRDAAWVAHPAAREAASEAARAAMWAASAADLHSLAAADQVKRIVGAGAQGARAAVLLAGDDRAVGAERLEHGRRRATPAVVELRSRYPRHRRWERGWAVGRVAGLARAVLGEPVRVGWDRLDDVDEHARAPCHGRRARRRARTAADWV